MQQVIFEFPIRIYRAVLSQKSKIFHEKKHNLCHYHAKFQFIFLNEVYQNKSS